MASVRETNVVAQIKSRNGRANPDKPQDKWKWKLPRCLRCLLRVKQFLPLLPLLHTGPRNISLESVQNSTEHNHLNSSFNGPSTMASEGMHVYLPTLCVCICTMCKHACPQRPRLITIESILFY